MLCTNDTLTVSFTNKILHTAQNSIHSTNKESHVAALLLAKKAFQLANSSTPFVSKQLLLQVVMLDTPQQRWRLQGSFPPPTPGVQDIKKGGK